MVSTEVTKREVAPLYYAPDEVIASAKEVSEKLKALVESKPAKVVIHGEQYLEFEDWQTLGQFYGVAVTTGEAMPVEVEGVKGARAVAKLISFRTGEVVGGAEAYCMRDEANWQDKPWFQLASMAQTRAGAKALRNRLAWVVVLAGYKPTPREEFNDEPRQTKPKQTKVVNREPATVKTTNQLMKACFDDYGLYPSQVLCELNLKSITEIADPGECYARIASVRK